MASMIHCYCDGGLLSANPSQAGGTWAVVCVDGGRVLGEASGIVTPAEARVPAVTNNYAELLAATEAMERFEFDLLFTDSQVTYCRLIGKNPRFAGIPIALKRRFMAARANRSFGAVLLDGHPTKKQLANGRGKTGNPVSSWNVRCDRECTRLAEKWKTRKRELLHA